MAVATVDVSPAVKPRGVDLPWAAWAGGVVFAMIVVAVTVGPFFLGDPGAIDLVNAKAGVGTLGHPLGTDAFGRDILTRVLEGGRVSLIVGLSSVLLCLLIGGWLGTMAGYLGGKLDTVIMRFMDIVLAFPALVLALAVAAFLGPSLRNVVFAVTFAQVPHYARLARATALSVRERDYVVGSSLLGSTHRHIVTRHVIPSVAGPLVVYGLLAIGLAILIEASLSFLGLGVRPPTPSWGGMIAEARPYLQDSPHIALVPGVALFLTVLSLNLLADGVRSAVADRERAS